MLLFFLADTDNEQDAFQKLGSVDVIDREIVVSSNVQHAHSTYYMYRCVYMK